MQLERWLSCSAIWLVIVSTHTAHAQRAPIALEEVGITERLGSSLSGDLRFRDHRGEVVKLSQYFDGHTPVLLTLNYFRCRTVCDLQLVRLASRLRELDAANTPYRALAVSIDPRDTPEMARGKLAQHGKAAGPGAEWNFLVGDEQNISALARELGSTFRYDARSEQYAHAPALFVATPKARIARYLYGVDYPPRDVRFALIEAAAGRSGSSLDKILLTCFQYDSTTGRYGPYVLGIMRVGGVITVIGIAIGVVLLRRGELRRSRQV